jgi:hypothetical protein
MTRPILRSRLLTEAGLQHGFTTRKGGVSQPPFDTFNLSDAVGDTPDDVAANRRRFARYSGLAWSRLVELEQVHGDAVLVVDRPPAELPGGPRRRCDASVTDRPDAVLGVRTADCTPLLLASTRPRAAAAVHAGWRGTLAGVAARAVAALERCYGCRPADLLAVIGPCIHRAAYRVGPDVYAPFAERFGDEATERSAGALRVDLVAANRRWLRDAGLAAARIEVLDCCTFERADLFFSHRRDRGRSGRQLAFITLAPEAAAGAD